MGEVLFTWLGTRDVTAMQNDRRRSPGAVVTAIQKGGFADVHVLIERRTKADVRADPKSKDDEPGIHHEAWRRWAQEQIPNGVRITTHRTGLAGTRITDHGAIYEEATRVVDQVLEATTDGTPTFHLSSGTPSMHAVWVLMAKTRRTEARLVQTSDRGTPFSDAKIPFSITTEYSPLLDTEQVRPCPGFLNKCTL